MDGCEARARGTAADLPRKLPKKAKPTRLGTVYVARREDGAFLVETRAEKGLLGGMLGWPGTEWSDHAPEDAPPVDAAWTPLGEEVRHTFTHFHLKLSVQTAVLGNDAVPLRGRFIARREFRPSDMPTVMRKAYDLASETLAAQAEQEEAAGSPD